MATPNKKILLVGGGTGGHAVPIFLIYNKLKNLDPSADITVVGSGSQIEKRFFADLPGYRVLRTGKVRRHLTPRNIIEAMLVAIGFIQSFFILFVSRPRIIFSKGGFVAVPILAWAKFLGIPYLIHESDTEMGIGNKINASLAKKIFVAFPEKFYKGLPNDKTTYDVPIVREEISQDVVSDRKDFGFTNDDKVIFITGGSQGAHNINENVIQCVKRLLGDYNVIHQTGDRDLESVLNFRNSLSEDLRQKYYVTAFLQPEKEKDWMNEAFNLADLVVARAGATTIFELAISGKPMILIPWKHAAADHQNRNAQLLEESGGAIVISDDDLTPDLLQQKISDVFEGDTSRQLSTNAKTIFRDDGLGIVSQAIIEELKQSE